MRDIIFRGKRTDNGEWVYGWPLRFIDGKTVIVEKYTVSQMPAKDFLSTKCVDVDSKTIGQYTQLQDRRGRDIFEGDILKTTDPEDEEEIGWVDYEWHGCPNFVVGTWYTTLFIKLPDEELDIIGNIYDNPEIILFDTKHQTNKDMIAKLREMTREKLNGN